MATCRAGLNGMGDPLRNETLAIFGGEPVRRERMPPRLALGDEEVRMIQQVVSYYRESETDPGYQGPFEKLYTDAFVEMMGGGYADAVATGTASLFVSLAALDLPKGSEVLVSPITDPGSLSAIILNGLKPRLCDSKPDSYNIGLEQVRDRLVPNVSAILSGACRGSGGRSRQIVGEAHSRGVRVIEDCSQSHGAKILGQAVGSFGDIAAFSTMYRKAHMTGPSGGVIYCRDLELFRKVLAHADRGKPRWREDFSDRDPSTYLFPALNHHTDEISCAIGVASLGRLGQTIMRRLSFVSDVAAGLAESVKILPRLCPQSDGFTVLLPDHRRCRRASAAARSSSPRRCKKRGSTSIRIIVSWSTNGPGCNPISPTALRLKTPAAFATVRSTCI